MTTTADLLQNARPPIDDEAIDKALADLDSKIWEWTDALKSAHSQLRAAFAVRPPVAAAPPQRPSAALFETLGSSLSEAAAAAHLPKAPPLPDWATRSGAAAAAASAPPPPPMADSEWPTPPPKPSNLPALAPEQPRFGAVGTPTAEEEAQRMEWPQWPPAPPAPAAPPAGEPGTGVMAWPTNQPAWQSNAVPAGPPQPQSWPSWTPTNTAPGAAAPGGAAKGSNVRASKAPKAVRQAVPEGPTAEERARKAAEEEERLSQLEEAISRRVRLLRRLDPDTPIEKLIEKATQSAAEAAAAPKEDKSSGSSWWRRK